MLFLKKLYIIKYNLVYKVQGEDITMVRKAYAKINIGLDVLRRRADGYHEVRMIMQTIGLHDELQFTRAESGITLRINRPDLPAGADNLVYRAAELMLETYGIPQGVCITLEKNIPMAAGLAGGSADAAATLKGLNDLFRIGATQEELRKLGVRLGADVPYCIMGGTALAEGIGEILTPLRNLPQCKVLIAKPNIDVSTAFVYRNLHVETREYHPDVDAQLRGIAGDNLPQVIQAMGNILELVTIPEYPVIEEIKQTMKQAGAMNAMMSGSGPTVFGLFQDETSMKRAYEAVCAGGLARDIVMTEFVTAEEMLQEQA